MRRYDFELRKRSTSRSNPGADMTTNNPQVPWTDEQWARVNQVIQEEASRARSRRRSFRCLDRWHRAAILCEEKSYQLLLQFLIPLPVPLPLPEELEIS